VLDVKDRVVLALPTRDVVMADVSLIDVESGTVIQIPSMSLDLLIALLSFWALYADSRIMNLPFGFNTCPTTSKNVAS
jgi:hypothetical protein